MTILVDLNVVLDVVQQREPHYAASAALITRVIQRHVKALLPAHAITTLHYLVGKHQNAQRANETIDWLLRYFDVASVGWDEILRARSLQWPDFEDAVVAAAAESAYCTHIITRNLRDFAHSPVSAITPEEFLAAND